MSEMMDSQEKLPAEGMEEKKVETTAEAQPQAAAEPAVENQEEAKQPEEATAPVVYKSKKEVIARLKDIVANGENPRKEELDHLKSAFYRLHNAEREEQQRKYIEDGGDPDKYQFRPDEDEEVFKAEMAALKERRAKLFQQQEEEKQNNLKRKLEIIEKIKAMATSPDEANKSFNEFKALQQEWKEIKAVPAERANEVWRSYQLYVEQFYDLLNLNREAREYDFKKNLEAKTHLCEEAEALEQEKDVVSAFRKLQDLHQRYRETGPVAKELREQIWARFKAASTVINKRHQEHFEQLKAKEEENLTRKTALCEKVEEIAKEENKTASDWEKHSRQIIAVQAEWKTIGFAPKKMNEKIFERFRAACDDFFTRKAEFFKTMKQNFAENAEKKRALVEQAKALTDSTEWKATADKLIELQKQWKQIGAVPKKLGDQLWSEFLGACNHFFEARNAATSGQRTEEKENLKQKRDIVRQLRDLAEQAGDDIQQKAQELIAKFNQLGHVPFRDKDKLYKDFHDVTERLYRDFNVSLTRRRLDSFKGNLKNLAKRGEDAIDSERGRLMRRYEQLKQEIATYENNLGFLNISSKSGNSLIDQMNRKVQKLRDEAQLVRDKIKAIDSHEAAGNEEKKLD